MNSEFHMNLALQEAWKYQGITYPNPAVGALVQDSNNQILSIEAHKYAGGNHAEVEAIKSAYEQKTNTKLDLSPKDLHEFLFKNHNDIFKDATMFVTLEPCVHFAKTPPCSELIKALGFKKVVIGSSEIDEKASGGAQYLQNSNIEVKQGVLSELTDKLLYPFKKWNEDRFVFFKLASYLNGNCTINKQISSIESRTHVHEIRKNIELLVIGGNTVRRDRPHLDTRLINGDKNPDVLILSSEKKFDTTIPLFHVPNRKVYISNNLNRVKNYKFVMIEGTKGMLKACKDIVDWNMTFINPSYSSQGENIAIDKQHKVIHSYNNKENIIIWSE